MQTIDAIRLATEAVAGTQRSTTNAVDVVGAFRGSAAGDHMRRVMSAGEHSEIRIALKGAGSPVAVLQVREGRWCLLAGKGWEVLPPEAIVARYPSTRGERRVDGREGPMWLGAE